MIKFIRLCFLFCCLISYQTQGDDLSYFTENIDYWGEVKKS